MTDQNSPADAAGTGRPSGQPGSFGPPQQPQAPQQGWQGQAASQGPYAAPQQAQGQQPQGPYASPQQAAQGQQASAPQPAAQGQPASAPQPQRLSSDAARAQVAAAWVRNQPRAGQAAVPSLPPRETRPQGESKKEKRERERAERKAVYEAKKAAREQRRKGGSAAPVAAAAQAASAPTQAAAAPAQAAPAPMQAASAPAQAAAGPTQSASTPPAVAATASTAPFASNTAPTAPTAPTTATLFTTTTPTTAAPADATTRSAKSARPGHPQRGFDVPRPGGRISSGGSGGRRTHVALRATLLITTCVFALGSCGVMGLMAGRSGGTATAGLDTADVAKYRLTEFPTRQAASFAEQYALLCMTFSPETASERRDGLARYASSGVDPDCGWSGTGTSTAVSATWDGTAERLPEYGDHGRFLGVQVRTEDGALTTLTVPVYVRDLTTGEGMRVAGDVGQMPMPARADVPEVDRDDEVVDASLSKQLQDKVLPGYFAAWGASDPTAMARFTTPDASLSATSGLAGSLANPAVGEVAALVPASVRNTDPFTYPEGQAVQLRVVVNWGSPEGEEVRRAYRMTVVNTAQGWFIKDIRGGVPDARGGRADSAEDATTPSASATPAPSGSASPSATPSASATP